jgi:hypothetical protein
LCPHRYCLVHSFDLLLGFSDLYFRILDLFLRQLQIMLLFRFEKQWLSQALDQTL